MVTDFEGKACACADAGQCIIQLSAAKDILNYVRVLFVGRCYLRDGTEMAAPYARARSLRMLMSSTGRSGMVIRNVAPMVPSTR
jgi:hypothetical protein